MQYRKKKEQIAFEVIEAAIGGDAVAINQIIDYFQPYINSCLLYTSPSPRD